VKRKIVALGWLGTLVPCFQLVAQVARFHFEEDRMVVEDRSGRKHVLEARGVDRKSVRISPDGSRLIWHLEFAGYGHDPRIPVRLWSPSRPEKIVEYQVPTYSRYLETVEWIDLRRVLIAGDGFGVVLDSESGDHLKRHLAGELFAISHDRAKIAFWATRGIGHAPFRPDRVRVTFLDEGKITAGQESEEISPGVFHLYPPLVELRMNVAAQNEDLTHKAWSRLQWFSDSRRLAFLEWHNRSVWLVVLRLSTEGGTLNVEHDRFILPIATPPKDPEGHYPEVYELSWAKQDEELVYVHNGQRLIVSLASRSAKWEAPQ